MIRFYKTRVELTPSYYFLLLDLFVNRGDQVRGILFHKVENKKTIMTLEYIDPKIFQDDYELTKENRGLIIMAIFESDRANEIISRLKRDL